MKVLFTALFFLILFPVVAQERTVSGRLTSNEDGNPLPGINIIIKGTSIGTTTDADGNYEIKVPIGATLVFSFIGMQSREVIVTENNLQPVNSNSERVKKARKVFSQTPIPPSLYQDSVPKNEVGVATLTDQSPSYRTRTFDPLLFRSIRKTGSNYTIRTDSDLERRTGFGLQVSSSLTLEKINRLPSFQNTYAQGRPANGTFQWAGADQQEIFSWGPQLRTLEFDGTNYPFDKNGKLVLSGSGNGQKPRAYDASTFFKTGFATINEVMFTIPGPNKSTFIFDFENKYRSGVIPNADYTKTNFASNLRNYKLSPNTSANVSLAYNRSHGTLLGRGANLATIVGSVYRTPISFDNTNALAVKSARASSETYTLDDGTKRSHAPAVADNPYGLVNELPDREEGDRLMTSVNINHSSSQPFTFVFNANMDKQRNENIFGMPPGYATHTIGRLSQRAEQETFVNAVVTPGYRVNLLDNELKLGISYQVQYYDRHVQRVNSFYVSSKSFGDPMEADSLFVLSKGLSRITHEIIFNANYEYNQWLNVRMSGRNYFSSTANASNVPDLLPSGSVSINLSELIYLEPVDILKVYATTARTIREASLVYSNWSYGSTSLPLENYASFFESDELFFTSDLLPETERKFETGIKVESFYSRLRFNMAYYSNLTDNFIAPARANDRFTLANIASIHNYGATIAAGYSSYHHRITWGTDVTWSKHNSVVRELNSPETWIALSGFETVQSVMAKGRPLGAIYGTSVTRNSSGEKVIGSDGFPLEDVNLKMIGNPIPDWILGWSAFARSKNFKFSFLFDFRKGGDVWNGTNSVLDYLGRSRETGLKRNTNNYIFDGVNSQGNLNVIPVTFSDSGMPPGANRWVRYGWDGIAEDYIEDASWIRLSELVVSYSLKPLHSKIKEVRFSLIGRNVFLITPYSGVDPASSLFGYATGNGLDLFNAPSTRSYGAQITLKI